jgi:hypothetical protein
VSRRPARVPTPERRLRVSASHDGILGPRYCQDALILESVTDHIVLVEPARIARHVDAVVSALS